MGAAVVREEPLDLVPKRFDPQDVSEATTLTVEVLLSKALNPQLQMG